MYMLLADGGHPLYIKGESPEVYKEKLHDPVWNFPETFNK